MRVIVVGVDEHGLPEAAACESVTYEREFDPSGPPGELVLVAARHEGDLEMLRAIRRRFDPDTHVVAITWPGNGIADESLLDAGADDVCFAGPDLVRRLPFLTRRISTRGARERRLQAILDTTVDGIVVIDDRGLILSFNPSAERIFGFSEEEVVGENVGILMPEPFREEHDSYIDNYLGSGRRKIIGIGREVIGLRRDGSTFPMDLAVSEVRTRDGVTFTGVVRDISERRQLENEVLRISDQERRRIGQDLHDGLGQMLTGIGLISQDLARKLRAENSPVVGEVEEITELIREADHQARSLARGLVPVELDANGLAAAIQRLTTNAGRLFGIECLFEEVGSIPVRDSTSAINLYRIAQEAVSNAVKHGQATVVRVTLASGREQVRLRIQDNGIGFPEHVDEDRGMGVRIMHHRARVIGAILEIRRPPEGGTLITCTLPRSPWPEAAAVQSHKSSVS